jgi:hypothetical protein
MSERTVYVEKRPDIEWILGGTLFLTPYLGPGYQKLIWVDDLNAIHVSAADRKRSMFFRMDATGSLANVTGQILGQ